MFNINKKCMSFPWANYAKINCSRIGKRCLTIKIFIYLNILYKFGSELAQLCVPALFSSGTWLHFELRANIGSQAWNVSGTKSHVTRVTRYTDKIKEQLRQLSEAVDKMVDLVEGMKGTSKAIEERRKLLLSKQKFFKLQVKNPHCPPFHSFN